jgi:hypothetical protein
MAASAHARLSEFTIERAVERVEALYDELLSAKGRRVPMAAVASA